MKFEQSWCEYLTPCPYMNMAKDSAGVMVGDYDCSQCEYCIEQKHSEKEVICKAEQILEEAGHRLAQKDL